MELSIAQALYQGTTAHNSGNLPEAERLYREILQTLPTHPDANHNLGLIAVAVNNVKAALPLFKKAIKANPKIEQFYISYIEALVKEQQFDVAKQVLEEAKKHGVEGETLNVLKAQLVPAPKTEKANSANPSQQQLNNLLECYQTGRYHDAEKLAIFITQGFPWHPFGWKVLSAVLVQTGRKQEALKANQKAALLLPQDAEAHNNLGNTLLDLGRLEESVSSLRQAVALKSDYAEAHSNLGNTLQELGRLEEAEVSCRQAIALKPDFAEAHSNLAGVLNKLGRFHESIECYKQAIIFKPEYPLARMNLNNVVSAAVPGWHLSMMNDELRNSAYFEAIKLAVDDGALVLDIGTGSGLLSMMAAANGAGEVITCETSTTIAETAKKIIRNNGYEESVSVINKKSTQLIIGEDLPQTADLIISEVLSAEFVGEGVRSTILDAKTRLLKKDGTMIPRSGSIRICLLGNNPEILDAVNVSDVHGFDLSEFNSISQRKFSLSLKGKPLLLSEPEDAFSINFYDENRIANEEKIIQLRANKDGLCLGLIQWLKVQLYKDIEYENSPGENNSHWPTPVYIFDEPVTVKVGDVLEIRAFLGEDSLWLYHLE